MFSTSRCFQWLPFRMLTNCLEIFLLFLLKAARGTFKVTASQDENDELVDDLATSRESDREEWWKACAMTLLSFSVSCFPGNPCATHSLYVSFDCSFFCCYYEKLWKSFFCLFPTLCFLQNVKGGCASRGVRRVQSKLLQLWMKFFALSSSTRILIESLA